jgi:hypothetical protein
MPEWNCSCFASFLLVPCFHFSRPLGLAEKIQLVNPFVLLLSLPSCWFEPLCIALTKIWHIWQNAASTARGICVSAFSNRQHRSRSRTKKRVRSFQLPPGATMLRHLQRSLRAIHYSPIIGRDAACNPIPLHR